MSANTKIIPGAYRTAAGGTVQITGPHPRFSGMVVSSAYDAAANPGAYWWDTGVHPHEADNDLVERIREFPEVPRDL